MGDSAGGQLLQKKICQVAAATSNISGQTWNWNYLDPIDVSKMYLLDLQRIVRDGVIPGIVTAPNVEASPLIGDEFEMGLDDDGIKVFNAAIIL